MSFMWWLGIAVVEIENTNESLGHVGRMVVMFYCWGSQHSNNGLGLAVAHMSLNDFMAGFFSAVNDDNTHGHNSRAVRL